MLHKFDCVNSRWLKTLTALSAALALAVAGSVSAQTLPPQSPTSPQAALGSSFTYQGRLTNAGAPVDGSCDFQFSLWNAVNAGGQVGSTLTKSNISLSQGLFTVQLDFGPTAFTGDGRWLQIATRCPAGSGSYTTLSPRQPLTAAPYALALPGLYTQPNTTSPNVIGGFSGNSVAAGVTGATIGGGGESGYINTASGNYATIGGGKSNVVTGTFATVGGGSANSVRANDGYCRWGRRQSRQRLRLCRRRRRWVFRLDAGGERGGRRLEYRQWRSNEYREWVCCDCWRRI